MTGVSFVVPVHNGAPLLRDTLASIAAQHDGRPMEVIVVDDRSTDGSRELLIQLKAHYSLTVLEGQGVGAAAAVNVGIRAARYPVICQVDQDVILEPGWMERLVFALDTPDVAAAQGHYATDHRASFFGRVMGLDLEDRYAALGSDVDHVCTGNSAYRADALRAVGLLDESLGYGYDNDLSYRLIGAGYRLCYLPDARSRHVWRDGLAGYLKQQYGFGYGRLDLVRKHPSRIGGDAVSPVAMMAHPAVMGVALGLFVVAGVLAALGGAPAPWTALCAWAGLALLGGLAIERAYAGVQTWRRSGDPTALAFPLVHLVRDLAWVVAAIAWFGRRTRRSASSPAHSMRTRTVPR